MGEGEGAKDISDKIENEDQMQGAQQKGQRQPEVRLLLVCLYMLSMHVIYPCCLNMLSGRDVYACL